MGPMRIFRHAFFTIFLLCVVFFLTSQPGSAQWQGKKKKKGEPRMTEAELQSEVMSFADRYGVMLFQAFDDFDQQGPSSRARLVVLGDTVYSIAAAYTIAAEPNPEIALLDLVALTTLGRMIYEEVYLEKFGSPASEMVSTFLELQEDVWQIAKKVLTPQQQRELRETIEAFRRNHPKQLAFSHLRFSDFAAERKKSTLAKAAASGGMFGSVKQATREVEETRLLAERAMFLGTRVPLLAGAFADVWITQWLTNPEVERILGNMDKVSLSAERLSKEIEKLPDRFSEERDKTVDQTMDRVAVLRQNIVSDVMERVKIEREAAINQFMDRFASERERMISDLTSKEEESMRGLLSDLQQTIKEGNSLVVSTDALMKRLGVEPDEPRADKGDAKPFDINDYRKTAAEASMTIQQLSGLLDAADRLLRSPGWENTLPEIVKAVNQVEKEGERLVDHTFRQTTVLILIFLAGLVVALLIYRYASERFIGGRQEGLKT